MPDDISRLLTILLDNAVKYCDAGGTIHLALFSRRKSVELALSNPCAGWMPRSCRAILTAFTVRTPPVPARPAGAGIGLSTAKAIVTRHHGRIGARYESGIITFQVTLPQSGRK